MNALFGSEAKRLLLGFDCFCSAFGAIRLRCLATLFDACVEGGFQGIAQTPDSHVVEVQAVRPARFQGFDVEVLLGDLRQELLELVHFVSFDGVDDERMNALFPTEAKRIPMD